jgi:hypothetical protein
MARIVDGSAFSLFRQLKRDRKPPPGEWHTQTKESKEAPEETGGFRQEMVEGLPEGARRWFLHSIRHGTALATRAELEIAGEFRLGSGSDWFRVQGRQNLAPPLRSHAEGSARQGMRWLRWEEDFALGGARRRLRLFGFVPALDLSGPDFSRSMQDALVLQSLWVPPAILPQRGAVWSGDGPADARAVLSAGGRKVNLTLGLNDEGGLRWAEIGRWGAPDGQAWGEHPFRLHVREDTPYTGLTVPTVVSGGWVASSGEVEETFRFTVESFHAS